MHPATFPNSLPPRQRVDAIIDLLARAITRIPQGAEPVLPLAPPAKASVHGRVSTPTGERR